jgi:hypothetical protein
VLRNLHAAIAGVQVGRVDVVFTVAVVIIALSGIYFGLVARRQALGRTRSISCEVLDSSSTPD